MPSRLTTAALLVSTSALAACAHRSTSAPARGTTRVNYAIQQAYADSVEQARVGAFLAEYQQRARPLQRAGNYLGEIQLLRQMAARYPTSTGIRDLTTQQIGTISSFLGDPAEALRLFDQLDEDSPAPLVDTTRLEQLRVTDAAETIARTADSARVIFINEAHHVPQTRLLTLSLLAPLRAKGFTYLAAETLSPFDSSLNARDYPVHASGYYSNEPLFGEVLREARRLGYTLVPYEAIGARGQDARETGQATNLRDRIFRDHPDARVLVHAGYSHIDESGTLGGAKPMAVRFRELTGIDPLTVDQTTMRERASRAKENPAFRHLVDRAARTMPFVLLEAHGRPWTFRPGVHDVTVFLPRTQLRDGRPDWLWRAGDRQSFAVRGSWCAGHEACVVMARLAGESADAVPRDVVRVTPNDTSRSLALPAGRYAITVRDVAGTVLADTTVSVLHP
jgi:tetratricopeptide (TPR) repeat protein